MQKKTIIIIAVVAVVALAALLGWATWQDQKKLAQLKMFAQCVTKSGAQFYGAFWCSHCQDQKALFQTLFGSAEKYLPYVECSTPDTNGQLQACKDAGIKGYPTWKFAGGATHEGFLTLKELGEKASCQVP